jgi:hypothetical protein
MKFFTFITLAFLIFAVFCDAADSSKASDIQENLSPSSSQSRLEQLLQSVTEEVFDTMTDAEKQAFIDEIQTLVNGGRHIYQNPNQKNPNKNNRA